MESALVDDVLNGVFAELDTRMRARVALTCKQAAARAWADIQTITFTEKNVIGLTAMLQTLLLPKLKKVVLDYTFFPERLGVPPFLAQLREFEWKMKVPLSAYEDYNNKRSPNQPAYSRQDERIFAFEEFVEKCLKTLDFTLLESVLFDNLKHAYEYPHVLIGSFLDRHDELAKTNCALQKIVVHNAYSHGWCHGFNQPQSPRWENCKNLRRVFFSDGGFDRDAETGKCTRFVLPGFWDDFGFHPRTI